jgi:transcriptional regulator with XRE-family HTH domain
VADLEGRDSFAEWLRIELRARRMSVRQLALRSGVDHSTISRILTGNREPGLKTALALVRVFRSGEDDVDVARDLDGLRGSVDPVAAVERAFRADSHLSDDQVRDLMRYYLTIRAAAARPPATKTRRERVTPATPGR